MSDEIQVAEELYAFTRALEAKIARLRRGEHCKEDAIQELVLAGSRTTESRAISGWPRTGWPAGETRP